jgi:haloacetate dehalogenase
MFEGFDHLTIPVGDAKTPINAVRGGSGPPVLLLHGYPQTHAMWHAIAPALAQNFTVVCADLRGYGDSSKPPGDPEHLTYSKRAMAADQLGLMQALGYERFALVGHDRGARVAHRMGLDAPERITRLVLLDIAPTYHVFKTIDQQMASAYYHWFFLSQPFDLPERLIGADPIYYLHKKLGAWGTPFAAFDPAALAAYERSFRDPATIHASCEDYRAAASIDLVHDAADRSRRLTMPLLVLWGGNGKLDKAYNMLSVWGEYAEDVRGHALPTGHFLAEERPQETLESLLSFLMPS